MEFNENAEEKKGKIVIKSLYKDNIVLIFKKNLYRLYRNEFRI